MVAEYANVAEVVPAQTAVLVLLRVMVGFGLTVITTLAVLVQPPSAAAAVTVTV